MSVARQRRKSQGKAGKGNDPVAILSTGIDARDRLRGGLPHVREVRVTARQSVKMPFAAPRIDMGEYAPVSTNALEAEKNRQGF